MTAYRDVEALAPARSQAEMKTSFATADAVRIVVVAPTFNNARTLRAVLDGIGAQDSAVIAVDDGSGDATPTILAGWADAAEGRHVVTHATNRGKAAAMRSGFALARTLGYTHAVTIDTDGQHDPLDLPAMRAACAGAPHAIVVGARPMGNADYPLRSRVGRLLSNALVWAIGGVWVADSQCGLRAYPLDVVATLGAQTSRYAFETEVLARAGWSAVPVVEVPVRCIYKVPGGRVTHFRPWRDSLSAAWMHVRLLARSLSPWPAAKLCVVTDDVETGTLFERFVRWMNPMRTWRRLRVDVAERDRLATAAGVGLFIGTQPAFGLKTILCLVVARAFRLQPLAVMAASSLSTPPLGFTQWAASIAVGHLLLHGAWPALASYNFRARAPHEVLQALALEWVLGAVVVGASSGIAAWWLVRAAVRRSYASRR